MPESNAVDSGRVQINCIIITRVCHSGMMFKLQGSNNNDYSIKVLKPVSSGSQLRGAAHTDHWV